MTDTTALDPIVALDLDHIKSDTARGHSLDNFLLYASHKILDQALPTFFDGLGPAQRKLLLSMQDLKAGPDAKTQKSTRIVAHSGGNYHTGGNTYGVLVGMSQRWRVPALLTEPEGNWGPIENNVPAAERYTEIKMSHFGAAVMFEDLPAERVKADRDPHGIVPSTVTYTDLFHEENYLPARIPMLLVNGQNGIAVGIAQTWQPLAIRPLLGELRRFLAKGEIDYTNLRLGYPTQPAITTSQADFITALKTGRGSVRTAGKSTFVTNKRGLVTDVVFSSVPYNVTTNKIGDELNAWMAEPNSTCPFKRFDNETEATTEENPITEQRLVFVLKDPTPASEMRGVLQALYKKVTLQDTHTVNMTALKDAFPVDYTLDTFFNDWLIERSNIILRVAQRRHAELTRQHRRLEILRWIRSHIDTVTAAVQMEPTETSLYQRIAPLPGLGNPLQPDEIKIVLDINLRQLSKLAADELTAQMDRATTALVDVQRRIDDAGYRNTVIDDDLQWFQRNLDKLGVPDFYCEFDPALAELIDTAPKAGRPIARDAVAFGQAVASSTPWWTPSVGKNDDLDVIVQTANGSIIRLKNASVRGAPTAVNMVDPEDTIVSAFFSAAPMLTVLVDNAKLIQLPKSQLPYGTPVYPARLAIMVKSKTPFTQATPVCPTTDSPVDLLVIGESGLARRTPLKDIPTLRAGVAFPERVLYAAFYSATAVYHPQQAGLMRTATLDAKAVRPGSLKRVGALSKLKTWGPLGRIENGNVILIGDDKRTIYKAPKA